jgi:N utilization substance protein A
MNADFLDALRQIEKEKEIPLEVLLSTIESALETAYKKNFAATGDVRVRVSAAKGGFQVYCEKDVVDDVENEHTEISLTEARKHDPDVQSGDVIEIEVTPANFGRIAKFLESYRKSHGTDSRPAAAAIKLVAARA